ncbi:MAG TPA: NADH-quinone oxidoreductase subunit NuoG [Pseudomonadales bacterium]
MARIIVDGVSYEVRDGVNLLHACLSHGLDLPYFCWHPALGSVGACRQCAVVQYRDENDQTGRLTMACMTPAADGTRLSIRAEEAVRFRASVIEWLMLNHPHDCPVCEEGGECHLQDMTVMTGHTWRRYRGTKRTHRNQYLGPFVTHEMNRCITCYRCVRFYRDYAGGTDLDAFGSRDRMYFGRAVDGVLESEFAGNLVEVCPTGVFADKPFSKTYSRKWDLTSAPSVCQNCGVGCNTLPGERYGVLKRVHNRYHGDVNGYFLCDRGRFGTGYVNEPARLRYAGVRRGDGVFDAVPDDVAIERAAEALRGCRVIGIGSPRASLESNFVLQRLVGADHFCPGFSDPEAAVMDAVVTALATPGVRVPSVREVESADAVLVLGEDVSNTAPRLALALRQTSRNVSFALGAKASIPLWQDAGIRGHAGRELTPMFQATPLPTRLDGLMRQSVHRAPDDLARLGFAIARWLGNGNLPDLPLDDELAGFAEAAARVLGEAERPLVISGAGAGSPALVQAAAAVARALVEQGRPVAMHLAVPECNSLGVRLLGGGLRLGQALERLERGGADTVIVLENELTRRAPRHRLERAFGHATVIVLDCLEGWTPEQADLVLPAATFADGDGTLVSSETRAQRYYRVHPPPQQVAPSWRWLARIGAASGGETAARVAGLEHLADVLAALAAARRDLADVVQAGPGADAALPAGVRVPRQPHRYSGRTAMHANVTMHEPKPPVDEESPLSFTMEGHPLRAPGALLTYTWAPGWNSNQSIFKFQDEVAGHLRGGPAGRRLPVETLAEAATAAAVTVPEPFRPGGALRAVPLHDVFASGELALRSPAMRERAPAPFAVLAPADAERLGIADGSGVRLGNGEDTCSVTARIDPAMPRGAIGVLEGGTGTCWIAPGHAVQVEPDPDHRPADDGVIARG